VWFYELVSRNGKNFTKANPITDNDLEDCFKKWKDGTISGASWTLSREEIIRRDYDLSPENPNQRDVIVYEEPERLIASAIAREKHALALLEEARDLMSEKNGRNA
jgi:type I restriction enzyme M protein